MASWSELAFPPFDNAIGLWGFADDEIYAVGDGIVAKWNGDFWAEKANGDGDGHLWSLSNVWGFSNTKLWAGPGSGVGLLYSTNQGTTWTVLSTQPTGSTSISAIWGASASDFWVCMGSGNRLAHTTDTGATWTYYTPSNVNWIGVFGFATNDVYFTCGGRASQAGDAVLYHWNGSALSVKKTEGDTEFRYAHSVWGSGPTDVYVSGVKDQLGPYVPKILHSTDGFATFTTETITPNMATGGCQVVSIFGADSGTVYASTIQSDFPTKLILKRTAGVWDWDDQHLLEAIQPSNYPNQLWVGPGGTAMATVASTPAGMIVVFAKPAASGGGSDPAISNLVPTIGPITGQQILQFDVTDPDNDLVAVLIQASFDGLVGTEVVHDGIAFKGHYSNAANTRTSITNGYRYRILRDGGWPGSPTVEPVAIDSAGHENP